MISLPEGVEAFTLLLPYLPTVIKSLDPHRARGGTLDGKSMNADTQPITRREFVRTTAFAAAAAAAQTALTPSAIAAVNAPVPITSGIQVGAVSFVDEGVEPVLDIFQKAALDTIYLTTFTYGRGLAGRQIPGQPFPDHGKQESDQRTFRGGNYATPHAQFYKNTVLKENRAPEHGDLDIVAAVLPAARKRISVLRRPRARLWSSS